MKRFGGHLFVGVLAACAAGMMAPRGVAQVTVETIEFQNGSNGYLGTFDRRINLNNGNNGADVDTTVSGFLIDGDPEDSARDDYLIRFDDILGDAGIPAGAVILNATLDLRTQSSEANSAANSGESFNVYRLTKAFDTNSTLGGDFGDDDGVFTPRVDGVEPEQGEADYILGTFDHNIGESPMNFDQVYSASVTRAVQSWVNGDTNFGLAVVSDHTDNDDGWGVHSTGSSVASFRPKLSVTYTTSPAVQVHEFQQGLDGYTGTSDVLLNLVTSTAGTPDRGDDTVVGGLDASTESELFIDGNNATVEEPNVGDSYDTPYMIKFADIESLAGSRVYKAELIVTTGFSSASSDSPGPFTVRQMLVPFSSTSTYSEFSGEVDAMELAGEVGPEVAVFEDIDEGELMAVDVTSVVNNWLDGQANYGFYIGADGTANGWQVFTSGAIDPDLAPMLRIYSVPEPATVTLCVLGLVTLGIRRRTRAH